VEGGDHRRHVTAHRRRSKVDGAGVLGGIGLTGTRAHRHTELRCDARCGIERRLMMLAEALRAAPHRDDGLDGLHDE